MPLIIFIYIKLFIKKFFQSILIIYGYNKHLKNTFIIYKFFILPRNIYLRGKERLILGEIGFTHEILGYKSEGINDLYYPMEYFEDFNQIDLSFDIW